MACRDGGARYDRANGEIPSSLRIGHGREVRAQRPSCVRSRLTLRRSEELSLFRVFLDKRQNVGLARRRYGARLGADTERDVDAERPLDDAVMSTMRLRIKPAGHAVAPDFDAHDRFAIHPIFASELEMRERRR